MQATDENNAAEPASEDTKPLEQPTTTSLEEQLAAAQAQAKEYLEGWQRERAEFANYKRRMERDLQDIRQNASVEVLAKMFPILIDFERAIASVPEEMKDNAWLEGIVLIQRKYQKLLEDHDVVAVDPTGEPFNPTYHEAVGADEDTEVPSGHVTATLQKGYRVGERVLRPALVRVAR